MKRLKVLMSAYACEPGKGSEPGVGWNVAREMAKYHDIWVITRANNREVIEAELTSNPQPNLHFVYYDLPQWAKWWKKGGRGVQLYYYLWQISIYPVLRKLHGEIKFDLTHHITFGKYWAPSLVSFLPVPFIWGSVGGGESAPITFQNELKNSEQRFEQLRDVVRWFGEHDPLVRATARNSTIALATTSETARRLKALGCKTVFVEPQVAMAADQFKQLANLVQLDSTTVKFISIGRPLHWKGFYLGLRAFAEANIPECEYWLIANGPERRSLEELAKILKITDKVRFIDSVPTLKDVYKLLGECHVLVHPALHEAFGNVVLEAMAAGKPVICLDLGGPAVQVTETTGFKIPVYNPEQVVVDMASAMKCLVENQALRARMGEAGQQRVNQEFSWDRKTQVLNNFYFAAVGGAS